MGKKKRTVPLHWCLSLVASHPSPELLTHHIHRHRHTHRQACARIYTHMHMPGWEAGGEKEAREKTLPWPVLRGLEKWGRLDGGAGSWSQVLEGRHSFLSSRKGTVCLARRSLCLGFCCPPWRWPPPFFSGGDARCRRVEADIRRQVLVSAPSLLALLLISSPLWTLPPHLEEVKTW